MFHPLKSRLFVLRLGNIWGGSQAFVAVHPIGSSWDDYVRSYGPQNNRTYPNHYILYIKEPLNLGRSAFQGVAST